MRELACNGFIAALVLFTLAAGYWCVYAVGTHIRERNAAALQRERNEVCVKICEDLNGPDPRVKL